MIFSKAYSEAILNRPLVILDRNDKKIYPDQNTQVQCGINSIPTEGGFCECLEGYLWKYPDDTDNFDCIAAETEEVDEIEITFPDVPTTHKNYTAINYLKQKGVINGYPDGSFQPLKSLNRAELIKILVGGKGIIPTLEQGYKNCFPDVNEEWFAPYVCYAKEKGWVSGYPDGTFQAAKIVIKAEAIKMLVNSHGYPLSSSVNEFLFGDVDNTQWYTPFIKAAKDRGLLEETSIYGIADEMKRETISENIYRAMFIEEQKLESFLSN